MTAAGHAGVAPTQRLTSLALIAGLSLFWGFAWPAMKLAVDELPVWSFRTICLLAGGGALLAIGVVARLPLAISRRELGPLLLVALFNITGWHLLSATGVANMAPGRASIIAFTMPLWAALLARPVLGEPLQRATLIGLALGVAGVGCLVAPDWQQVVAAPLGPLCMLGAAACWAAGTVGLRYFRWSMPVVMLSGWQLLLGGIPVALGALVFDRSFDFTTVGASAWLATLYTVLLPMVFCHWAWFKLVGLLPAVAAGIATLAIPVIGVASSAIALGEPVGLDVLLALLLVGGALAVVIVLPALRGGWRRPAS